MSPQKNPSFVAVVVLFALIMGVGAVFALVNAQTDASVTPLTPGWGGPNYDQPLWTITYDKAVIPVSFTSYHCTSAALVLEYATWADYTKLDWQTGKTNQYTGFIPASAADLSQKVSITIPNLIPSTAYVFRVGAQCTSSSPMGSLVYTTGANQFATLAAPPSKTYAGRAEFQYGDAGGSIENTVLLTQKVINLTNAGSDADTFRTTFLVNPETRCGLRGANDAYPTNVLPNTLPTTLDTPLAVRETKYISVACVTNGLPTGPFSWGFKTISVGALETGRTDIAPLPLIAELYDTVNITASIPCNDSDGGTNSGVKGIATGTYAGAVTSYIAIYGQEPNPNSPKTTTDKFSTYIDHCSWDVTQLNEGYCDASGRLQAIGIKCPNGCKDGVCVASPSSSSVSSRSISSSFFSFSSLFSSSSASTSALPISSIPTSAVPVPVLVPVGPVISPPGLSTVPADFSPSLPIQSVTTPGIPPAMHPALSPTLPKVPTESPVQKPLSKDRVKVLKTRQQSLRRELRSLERSLLRKKNVAALSQIADLRDELSDLDLRDPSAAETLQSLQKEIADLRNAVTKKGKRGR